MVRNTRIALFTEQYLGTIYAKMAYGLMRYRPQDIVCVVDSKFNGQKVKDVSEYDFDIPIVKNVDEAVELGSNTLVLGIAPSGGKLPDDWNAPIMTALQKGMSIWNGLHDRLGEKFEKEICRSDQKIWDIRVPDFTPQIGMARAASLKNKRVLMIGTDMAIGKMTAGLELYQALQKSGQEVDFLATGQIGISITGKGIPLDAFIVDKACGAVEQLVMDAAHKDIVIIEGQGSLLNPGSTATLPLMRGACPTHLVLCHKADQKHILDLENIVIPDLSEFIKLNEDLASSCSTLPKAKCIGMALNTSMLSETAALDEIKKWEDRLGLPVTDVVRFGSDKLVDRLV
tara:strand:+ start:1677 stop:2705 length:1029 start_codon:yes stop_codon:yes gene_type:complete